jgi:hypothetical protein
VTKPRETTVTTELLLEPAITKTQTTDREPLFESEIVSKKQAYGRGNDSICSGLDSEDI